MSLKRYAAKRDENEKDIIDALQRMGAEVYRLSASGLPDLLVGWRGINYLVEVKQNKGKHTAEQIRFQQTWTGQQCTIRTVDEAIELLQTIKTKYT